MCNKRILNHAFISTLFFLCFGCERHIPIQPFFQRYNDAKMIFTGQLMELKPANEELKVFSEFSKEDIKKAKLKVITKWKGEMGDTVEVYLAWPKTMNYDVDVFKKAAIILRDIHYVFYVQVRDGKNIIQKNLGVRLAHSRVSPEPIPLEKLKNGASMDEAILLLPPEERRAYEQFKRTGKIVEIR